MGTEVARHVLVVDDDPAMRRLISRIFGDAGLRVTAVGDFREAMMIIEGADDIAVLLTDIGLPDGTPHGFSLGAAAHRLRPDLKVVYMTGDQTPEEFPLFSRDCIVLQKPFTAAVLRATINSLLSAP